jgi:hypothetical protein
MLTKYALLRLNLPGGIRTLDHLLRRQMLYPAELQGDDDTGKFYDKTNEKCKLA